MAKTIRTTVYSLAELSPAAKEKARAWWRQSGLDYAWYEYTYEDAKTIAALMGITISEIYFSGFSSQGDGACFDSTFEGKEGGAALVKEYAPLDTHLHAIADAWEALQKRYGYKIHGTTRQQGRYLHEQCTRVTAVIEDCQGMVPGNDPEADRYEFDTDDSMVRGNEEPGAEATQILRSFMQWIYRQLEKENDYLNSDEAVDEAIEANEYTFTKSGRRFG